ncbi:UNVERIFIED_CONTAM: hypothetical protein K2H54_008055 [Gekko kuhli]
MTDLTKTILAHKRLGHPAFMLARFNLFLSAVLTGRYKGIPYKERVCTCLYNEPDSVQHILFRCSHHFFATPFFDASPPFFCKIDDPNDLSFLLSDKSPEITAVVAEYLLFVWKLRVRNCSI